MLLAAAAIRSVTIVLSCLVLMSPTGAAASLVEARAQTESLGSGPVQIGSDPPPPPVSKSETKAKAKPGKRPTKAKPKRAKRTTPQARVAPPPQAAPPADRWPSISARTLLAWVLMLVMVLALGGCGLAFRSRREIRAMLRVNADLERRRQSAEGQARRLEEEGAALKRRVADAEATGRRLSGANETLATRAHAAEEEARRLRFDVTLALAQSEFEAIAQDRANGDLDADLEMDPSELPGDPTDHARLLEEAKRLKTQLAALRAAGKQSPPAVLTREVLNGEERRIFRAAVAWVRLNKLRVCPQVSMGEYLVAGEGRLKAMVFGAFNARRADFLVCDQAWEPLFVIEHQGSGHRQGNWRLHDALKRKILKIADLPLVETLEDDPDEVVHRRLDAALLKARPPTRRGQDRARRA